MPKVQHKFSRRFLPAKWLAFAFWQLKRCLKPLNGDRYGQFVALTFLGGIEISAVVTVFALVSVLVGHRILPTSTLIRRLLEFGLVVAPVVGNHLVLIYRNRWTRHQAEFESYSANVQTIGGIAVFALLFVALIAVVMSATAVSHLPAV
jgi:hypothetical protein